MLKVGHHFSYVEIAIYKQEVLSEKSKNDNSRKSNHSRKRSKGFVQKEEVVDLVNKKEASRK